MDTFDTFAQMDYWLNEHPKHVANAQEQEARSNAYWASPEGKEALRQNMITSKPVVEDTGTYW